MFGIFRKKSVTALDAAVHGIYGKSPATTSADVERAVIVAHQELLDKRVPVAEVRHLACGLVAGPMSYSTYDLAVATALSFFMKSELRDHFGGIQIGARLRVLSWMTVGKVTPGALKIFEDTLYRIYKPSDDIGGCNQDAKFEAADRELDAKFAAFKNQNAGKDLHHVAKIVRSFVMWQHNFAVLQQPNDLTEEQEKQAKRVERAFLVGAAEVAADGFSLSTTDETLFWLNIVRMYNGFGAEEAKSELSHMFEASAEEKEAATVGGTVMINFLANGRADGHQTHLAALQKACWG